MKNTFYVLRYVKAVSLGGFYYLNPKGGLCNVVTDAAQYPNVGEALFGLAKAGPQVFGNTAQIVRVEEITTSPTERRIEVPLGDKRQTGVAIVDVSGNFYTRFLKSGFVEYGELSTAAVFASQQEALTALQENAVKRGHALPYAKALVGIAEESTPGTTTYNETVLA